MSTEGVCVVCNKLIGGRYGAIYCPQRTGSGCRQKAYRQRKVENISLDDIVIRRGSESGETLLVSV